MRIGIVEVQIHAILTSALDGDEWSASRLGRFTPGKSPWFPLDRRLGGPQIRSGRGCEEKDSHPLSGLVDRVKGQGSAWNF
jgi:hypothetical protein